MIWIFFIFISLAIIIGYKIKIRKRIINLMDKNEIKKLYDYKYILLEIKRKRRPRNLLSGYTHPTFSESLSIEKEYPEPPLILSIEDILEVYGLENNIKHLIYKTEWSKNYAIELMKIIDEYNKSTNFA